MTLMQENGPIVSLHVLLCGTNARIEVISSCDMPFQDTVHLTSDDQPSLFNSHDHTILERH